VNLIKELSYGLPRISNYYIRTALVRALLWKEPLFSAKDQFRVGRYTEPTAIKVIISVYFSVTASVVWVPGYISGGPGFDSRALQGGKKVVVLQRGPLSLVSTSEELLGRNSRGSDLESREYGRRESSRWPRGILYRQNVSTNFADRRRVLSRYSSLADWGHGVSYSSVSAMVKLSLYRVRQKELPDLGRY
jgi:hypothetical protein